MKAKLPTNRKTAAKPVKGEKKSRRRTTARDSERILRAAFKKNSCIRTVDPDRRREEGQHYKKGYEVRLVAETKEELAALRSSLTRLNIKPGKAYVKRMQYIQPVYGKAAVEWFLKKKVSR